MLRKLILYALGALVLLTVLYASWKKWGPPYPVRGLVREPINECIPEQVINSIHAKKRVPPRILYRYDLEANVLGFVQGAPPITEPGKDRFHLRPYRAGVYGTENLEDADRFGNEKFYWVGELHLKDECLVPERVTTLTRLATQSIFKHWYLSKKFSQSFGDWQKMCFDGDYPRPGEFKLYEAPELEETTCENVFGAYLADQHIAFVNDETTTRSWQVFDRTCIDHTEGTAQQWAERFWKNANLWTNTCDSSTNHRNRVRAWWLALAESAGPKAPGGSWDALLHTVAPPSDKVDHLLDVTDRFAAQDFSAAFDESYARCLKNKILPEWTRGLKEIALGVQDQPSNLISGELNKLCR